MQTLKSLRRKQWSDNANRARARKRMERPAPDYPCGFPVGTDLLRIRIDGPLCIQPAEIVARATARRSDSFDVERNGELWFRGGLSALRERLARCIARPQSPRAAS